MVLFDGSHLTAAVRESTVTLPQPLSRRTPLPPRTAAPSSTVVTVPFSYRRTIAAGDRVSFSIVNTDRGLAAGKGWGCLNTTVDVVVQYWPPSQTQSRSQAEQFTPRSKTRSVSSHAAMSTGTSAAVATSTPTSVAPRSTAPADSARSGPDASMPAVASNAATLSANETTTRAPPPTASLGTTAAATAPANVTNTTSDGSSSFHAGDVDTAAQVASRQAASAMTAVTGAISGPGDALQLGRSTSAINIMLLCGASEEGRPPWSALRLALPSPTFPESAMPWLLAPGLSKGVSADAPSRVAPGAWVSIDAQLGAIIANAVAISVGGTILFAIGWALSRMNVARPKSVVLLDAAADRHEVTSASREETAAADAPPLPLHPSATDVALRTVKWPSLVAYGSMILARGTALVVARLWSLIAWPDGVLDASGTVAAFAVSGTTLVVATVAFVVWRLRIVARDVGHVAYTGVSGLAGPDGLVTAPSTAVKLAFLGTSGWFAQTPIGRARLELDGKIFSRFRGGAGTHAYESTTSAIRCGDMEAHGGDTRTPRPLPVFVSWPLATPMVDVGSTVAMSICEGLAWRYCRGAAVVSFIISALVALWWVAVRPMTVPARNALQIASSLCSAAISLTALLNVSPFRFQSGTGPSSLYSAAARLMLIASGLGMCSTLLSVSRLVWRLTRRQRVVPLTTPPAADPTMDAPAAAAAIDVPLLAHPTASPSAARNPLAAHAASTSCRQRLL